MSATETKDSCKGHSFPESNEKRQKEFEQEFGHEIEIVLLGNRNVGKTSLIFQYTTSMFSELYMPTTGTDFRVKIVETHNNKKVRVKLWDTSGDEKSRDDIANDLYRLASGFIVMYDITDIQSYNAVFDWMKLLDRYALDNAEVVVIGNKSDMQSERQITKEEGIRAAACYEAKFMETSVLKNRNIIKTIKRMISNICEKREKVN